MLVLVVTIAARRPDSTWMFELVDLTKATLNQTAKQAFHGLRASGLLVGAVIQASLGNGGCTTNIGGLLHRESFTSNPGFVDRPLLPDSLGHASLVCDSSPGYLQQNGYRDSLQNRTPLGCVHT